MYALPTLRVRALAWMAVDIWNSALKISAFDTFFLPGRMLNIDPVYVR